MLSGRCRVAEGLRAEPVLTIGAFEIATEHSKAQGATAGQGVKKGFFFDGIVVQSGGVTKGDLQKPVVVTANDTYAALTGA